MSYLKPENPTGCTIWLTGLSGSGKTTIARNTKKFLEKFNIPAVHLDGDRLRQTLNSDLGFSKEDRRENIRRVAALAIMFAQEGYISLVSLISPYAEYRLAARDAHERAGLKFYEVYVNTPIEICEIRDPKQLYRKARSGDIPEFTGVSSPYEVPICPDLLIESGIYEIEECCNKVLRLLVDQQIIPSSTLDPVDRHLPITQKFDLIEASKMLPKIQIDQLCLQWAQVIAEGWATPLEGFMRENELLECLHFKTLTANNMVHSQSIPIVLPITDADKHKTRGFESVVLHHGEKPVGLLTDIEVYEDRKKERCARTFGSVDVGHPTIKQIIESNTQWLLGGKLQLFERIEWNDGLDHYRLTPQKIRHQLIQMKADVVFVFQLRNPLHNGHVLLIDETYNKLKATYSHPVLLLHPIGGWTKDDDVPLEVRIKQHQVLLDEGILDKSRTILAIFPSPMSYAGPTEVQWHAKGRIVAGVDCYIVGRDPAGVKDPSDPSRDLYDPTHGAKILQMTPGLKCLKIIPFRVAALNKKKNKMEFLGPDFNQVDYELISGSRMRQMAREGQKPPEAFMHPKAWQVLADYYESYQTTK
uniref:Bifunctional 3'-phosphoadenosine 5'-phosphosulfate synthase 2 n=1 Tax=Aceria tosichella TaxID=561515 RepID=A0A6G1SJH1_9ACAR